MSNKYLKIWHLFFDQRGANPNPEHSLTVYNAHSSPQTQSNMLTIALIGVPVVIAYTVSIYWIFRGKVKKEHLVY